jgi:hypothetical protein
MGMEGNEMVRNGKKGWGTDKNEREWIGMERLKESEWMGI